LLLTRSNENGKNGAFWRHVMSFSRNSETFAPVMWSPITFRLNPLHYGTHLETDTVTYSQYWHLSSKQATWNSATLTRENITKEHWQSCWSTDVHEKAEFSKPPSYLT